MDENHQPRPSAGLKRLALLVAGSISLVLGLIGVFVPLLPTTPFLLLAAARFMLSPWFVSTQDSSTGVDHSVSISSLRGDAPWRLQPFLRHVNYTSV